MMHPNAVPSTTKATETFMIVCTVETDNGTRSPSLFMSDEETVRTFADRAEAADQAFEIRDFMQRCNVKCHTRIVKVV